MNIKCIQYIFILYIQYIFIFLNIQYFGWIWELKSVNLFLFTESKFFQNKNSWCTRLCKRHDNLPPKFYLYNSPKLSILFFCTSRSFFHLKSIPEQLHVMQRISNLWSFPCDALQDGLVDLFLYLFWEIILYLFSWLFQYNKYNKDVDIVIERVLDALSQVDKVRPDTKDDFYLLKVSFKVSNKISGI